MTADFQPRPTRFGRYAVAEPPRFAAMHRPTSALRQVAWTIPLPVLDQEDLLAQGIDTSKIVSGAAQVDALGSCTANATTASLAERTAAAHGTLPMPPDAVGAEEWAIAFYHRCTDQTGDPSQEWPPTDCGSTGLYCCSELRRMRLIHSYQSGADVLQLLSMLQQGSVIQGTPFFNAWMEPDQDGFVDGDGSTAAIEAAIESGVAGGHETCVHAIEQLDAKDPSGPGTVLRVRNSWSASWGLSGDFRVHASTLDYLCRYASACDFKLFVV